MRDKRRMRFDRELVGCALCIESHENNHQIPYRQWRFLCSSVPIHPLHRGHTPIIDPPPASPTALRRMRAYRRRAETISLNSRFQVQRAWVGDRSRAHSSTESLGLQSIMDVTGSIAATESLELIGACKNPPSALRCVVAVEAALTKHSPEHRNVPAQTDRPEQRPVRQGEP